MAIVLKDVGSIHFDEALSRWVIKAGADVLIRLKRIFPRCEQFHLGEVRLKETDEICTELLWIMERFPLTVTNPDFRRLKKRSTAYEKQLERLQRIQNMPVSDRPAVFALQPRDYQFQADTIYREKGCLLLADHIGLGKTVSAIASFADPRTLPALVVVQTHLAKQWADEVSRFLPGLRVHVIKTKQHYPLPPAEVYIITYMKLAGWVEIFGPLIRSIVFDEVQELRCTNSEKYKSAKLISSEAKFRLGLSATPIYNYGDEVFNVLNILAPDCLGSREEFLREWCSQSGMHHLVKDTEALGHYLRSNFLMLRRTRKDVGRELLPVTKFVQPVEYDLEKFNEGISAAEDLANVILGEADFHQKGEATRVFDLKMRQATGVAKAPYVAALVRMLCESGEKVLLSGWHRAVHDIWAVLLKDLKPVFFTGEESPAEKQRSLDAFVEGDSQVFIISNRSGAGLNRLQEVCSVVVIGELDWSQQVINQVVGRIDRDGQDSPVSVYVPVCEIGSDPCMAMVLGVKRAQSAGIIELNEVPNELTSIDPERIKNLAREFLRSRGKQIPVKAGESANSDQNELQFELSA